MSQANSSNCVNNPSNNGTNTNFTPKHHSLETQRRRPSSIAEQAMRKSGIGCMTR